MRPLVWLALREQLVRRARVIDLVEVHVARLIEPVPACDEHHQRDQECARDVATSRGAPERQRGRQTPAIVRPRGRRQWPRRDGDRLLIRLQRCIAAEQPPGNERGEPEHEQSERDLAVAGEERVLEPLRRPQVVLRVAREGEVQRGRERDRERDVRHQQARAEHREREEQRERGEEIALVRPCRQEIEGKCGERAACEERADIATPPEERARARETGKEQDRAEDDVLVVGLPEVADDRPDVERVEAGEGIRLGRRANEVDELAGAGAERHAEREDRQQGRDSGAQGRPPVRVADPDEERARGDDDERDAELGLHHRGKSGDRAGGRPAAASREDQREQEREGPDGIDLSPVRTGEDRAGCEHPQRCREDRAVSTGSAPNDPDAEQRDRDIRGDRRGLDDEPRLSVKREADEPQHVEVAGGIVGEVPRLVEA